jgi:hypothetical protein
MDDLTSFSLRIPRSLAQNVEAAARRLGINKSEYARRALEEFDNRLMGERIAELSRRLAPHAAAAAMEESIADGLA